MDLIKMREELSIVLMDVGAQYVIKVGPFEKGV